MIYQVEITETLQKVVSIEAEDECSAVSAVKQLYRTEDIVLDSSDYIGTDIDILSAL